MPTFLDLLYDEAPLAAFDEHLAQCEAGLGEADATVVRSEYDVAVRLRDLMGRMRSREAELSALYETASDLTAIRDVDTILAAIVRRARQLLHCDMTYLSLNDEGDGASYMKVTDGALTREFQTLRLPLGTGLLGLVAQTGAAYFTEDYASDERFVHQGYIDEAVAGEQIRAILGVPAGPRRRGDRCPPRGAPVGAPLPAVGGQPPHLLRGPRGGGAGERPPVRRARRGQPLPHPAHRGRRRRRAGPRPAHRPAHRRRRRGRGGRGALRCPPRRGVGVDAHRRAVGGGRRPGVAAGRGARGGRRGGDLGPLGGDRVGARRRRARPHRARRHPGPATRRAARPRRSSYARARSAGHRAGPALRPLRHRRRGAPRRPAPRRPARVRPRVARAVARPRTTAQRQPRRPRGGRRRHRRRRRPAPREPRRRGPRAAQLRPRRRAPRRGGRRGAERGPPPRGGRAAGGRGRARGSGDRRRRRHERRAPRRPAGHGPRRGAPLPRHAGPPRVAAAP